MLPVQVETFGADEFEMTTRATLWAATQRFASNTWSSQLKPPAAYAVNPAVPGIGS
jgi:hypothetical protein